MAICVGCGFSVDNNGKLNMQLCDGGGIKCATPTNPSPAGCTNGIYADVVTNSPNSPFVGGCGMTVDSNNKIAVKIAGNPTNCDNETNILTCDADGLHANITYAIASNSATACHGATTDFLESPTFPQTITAPGSGIYNSREVINVNNHCADTSKFWAGVTEFDIGGIKITVSAGGYARASYKLYQGYAPGPVTFGPPNPTFLQIFDNTGNGAARDFALALHDTTWNVMAGGATLQYQIQLTVTAVSGTATVSSIDAQQYEINFLYAPTSPNTTISQGCP